MADRSLTLTFLGKDVSAAAAAEALAVKLKALESAQNDNNKASADLDKNLQKVGKSAQDAHSKGFSPLLDTALLLGPAIVPLGAAAVAAGAAFASMGAVGLLAFQGIKKEIQDGSALGQQYQAAFKPVVMELQTLEHIAAANVFGGINKGIQDASGQFPLLNQDVALLSTHLGSIVGNIGAGFVALLHDMNPLLVDMAGALDRGAAGFQRWAATSEGPRKFVAYAQTQLPKVEQLFKDVALAVAHLGEAAAPIGGALLQALDGIAQAISRIPVPVLTAMIIALDVGRLTQIGGALSGVSKALQFVGLSAGVAGPIIAGLAIIGGAWAVSMGQQAQQAAELTQATNDVTAALQASNGAFNTNVQDMLAKTAADTGVTASLDKLGLSQADYFNALAGGRAAQDHEVTVIRDRAAALGLSKAATIQLLGPIAQQINSVQQGTDKWNAEAQAIGSATKGLDANATAAAQQKKFLDDNNLTVEKATKKYNDAVAAAYSFTAQLGYMSKALDTLSNNQISAELGQLKLTDAWATGQGADSELTRQVRDHGKALNDNTADGRSNKEWLLQQIQAINQQALQQAKATGSIKVGTDSLKTNEAALRTSAHQAGLTDAQVNTLINTYAATPDDVTTSIRQQGAQAVVDALGGLEYWLHRIADPAWAAHIDIIAGAQAAQGGHPAPAAAGGLLMGPGGPTSDNLLIRASPGEYVVNAAAAAQNLPFLDAINNPNRIKAYAAGGLVGHLNLTEAASLHADISAAEAKARAAAVSAMGSVPGGGAVSADVAAEQAYALSLFRYYNWDSSQLSSLIALWNGESGWNPAAYNASSGATGIPQSLPASKMASAGPDYLTNPATQIRWGVNYISQVYGTPSAAYGAWLSRSPHWYGGGLDSTLFTRPTLIGVGDRGPETVTVARGDRRGGGGVTVVVNVGGSVIAEKDLVQAVASGMDELRRRRGRVSVLDV